MIIESISLKGWRSYDLDGVNLNNLKAINLIIGPNNSGKSNLSKYFYYLKSENYNHVSKDGLTTLKADIDEGLTWAWKKEDIVCEILLSKSNPNTDKSTIKLLSHHSEKNKSTTLNYSINDKHIFNEQGQILSDPDSNTWVDASELIDGYKDNSILWNQFLDSLVFIDPIRHHSRSSNNSDNFYFDGAKIIDELDVLKNDEKNKSKWLKFKIQIMKWLSEILSENVIGFEVSNNNIRLDFSSELSFSLDELGTGVSQIVMLLSHLWLNKDKSLNIFLDEPEANLHPDSVANLVNIFENELVNHKFFITTHSPSLIDCINDNWTVFSAIKDENGSSKISKNDNIIKYYETLDALGVKASQILQANTVIWVEGPSDRIYVRKWIEVFAPNELKEGRDFSFLFFGGTNLASFTALGDEEDTLINMLSTSRKAYLITDSDCASQTDKDDFQYKPTLTALLERVRSGDNQYKGIYSDLEDYFKIWITEGREIENYIFKDLLFDVLTSQGFKRETIGKKENKKNLVLSDISNSGFEFGKFTSFDKAISEYYLYAGGKPLESKAKENIAFSYASKKVPIAKEVTKKWEKKHANIFRLKEKIEELVEFIRK